MSSTTAGSVAPGRPEFADGARRGAGPRRRPLDRRYGAGGQGIAGFAFATDIAIDVTAPVEVVM